MPEIIVIMGPTASGKSGLALELAQSYNGVIINADSMQIYQELPILTAQPRLDQQISHLLYSIFLANDICSVGRYLQLATEQINLVLASNKVPIIVGGTGLYIKSLIEGIAEIPDIDGDLRQEIRKEYENIGADDFYLKLQILDPQVAAKLNPSDKQRILRAYEVFKQTGKSIKYWQDQPKKNLFKQQQFSLINLVPDRTYLYQNCNLRFEAMIKENVIAEIKNYKQQKPDLSWPLTKALGYLILCDYLEQKISLTEAIINAQQQTRNYAKRQLTWFRHQIIGSDVVEYAGIDEMYIKANNLVKAICKS